MGQPPGVAQFRHRFADAVWASETLRPNEKLVALAYVQHVDVAADPENDVAWIVWRRLSTYTGIRSKDALSRALTALREAGWLELVEARRQHKSPRYRLTIPDDPEVRGTYNWAPEVRQTDNSEVREADNWGDEYDPAEVRETNNWTAMGPVENAPEVRQNVARGTRGRPDPLTNPYNPLVVQVGAQPQTARELPGQIAVEEVIAELERIPHSGKLTLVQEIRIADPPAPEYDELEDLMSAEIGPCVQCGTKTHRYGPTPGSSPLCIGCRKARSA